MRTLLLALLATAAVAAEQAPDKKTPQQEAIEARERAANLETITASEVGVWERDLADLKNTVEARKVGKGGPDANLTDAEIAERIAEAEAKLAAAKAAAAQAKIEADKAREKAPAKGSK